MSRDATAKQEYLNADRIRREEIVSASLCDDGCALGLMSSYQAMNFERLTEIRSRKVVSNADRFRRKADFYYYMSLIADRTERIKHYRKGKM